jgi:hypothetical protein
MGDNIWGSSLGIGGAGSANPNLSVTTAGLIRTTGGSISLDPGTPTKPFTRATNGNISIGASLAIVEKATSASTAAGDSGTTLTTKDYVDGLQPQTATTANAGIIELATQAEVTAGTDGQRAVTPVTLAAALTAATPDATDTTKGIIELATSAETQTGTDTVRAVTPKAAADTYQRKVIASDTAPAAPKDGDLWFKPSVALMYYFSTNVWVSL